MEPRVKISISISYSACRSPKKKQKQIKYRFITYTLIINPHAPLLSGTGHARVGHLITDQSLWRPGFNPRPVHGEFMVDSVSQGQVSLRLLWFSRQYHSANAPSSFI